MISSQEISEIVKSGRIILERMPPIHGGCLYISALLVAMINDNSELNAKLVTGSLVVNETTVFSHANISDVFDSGASTSCSWDGHAWVSISGIIFDFSIFQTIYSDQTPKKISDMFLKIFGEISYLVGQPSKLNEMGVFYDQREVLTDSNVTALIQSADKLGLINS
ncbi:hypothetical protein ACTBAC_004499 [Vibrio parahaemolyticus]|nr:hypothetical protein [Vibrio parahaemolyticus]AKU54678.1 hypothetical protein FORC8_1118 [Vibrio parahaemolyticus]AKU54748.1 hypothetical protein FORC8_1188 [Vibrio parahaemolyticus]APE83734.1 hypothetical protein FORC18_1121 [Vibrio parahaemolyticus]APE83804.1 hypothetical protein FORC18_1191 [Vibrio parahaemolyticus]EGU9323527.1 hypothetical protein [Vibrio parahaemolyticus]